MIFLCTKKWECKPFTKVSGKTNISCLVFIQVLSDPQQLMSWFGHRGCLAGHQTTWVDLPCCYWLNLKLQADFTSLAIHTHIQKGDTVACSVGELKITFASTCNHGCKESVFNVLFNVLFLVLDFPLGAPNTLLKHVIEGSIWRIVVGEGSWWGWGFSQDW